MYLRKYYFIVHLYYEFEKSYIFFTFRPFDSLASLYFKLNQYFIFLNIVKCE